MLFKSKIETSSFHTYKMHRNSSIYIHRPFCLPLTTLSIYDSETIFYDLKDLENAFIFDGRAPLKRDKDESCFKYC